MAKRARTAGGLGDIQPQIMTLNTITNAPDVYSVDTITLPVARIGGSTTKAVVMEFLWVDWFLAIDAIGNTLQTDSAFLSTVVTRIDGDPCTGATQAVDFARPSAFACVFDHRGLVVEGTRPPPLRLC